MEKEFYANECIVFKKNNDAFGDLSNMATNYPLVVINTPIKTVEALYQLCRFPDRIDIQQEIIDCPSPMTVKIKSRKYMKHTRKDWDEIREKVMYWCLCLKLAQHRERFGSVLESTGDKIIVEESSKDRFWGAVRDKLNPSIMRGENKVGLQLMRLRAFYYNKKTNTGFIENIPTPRIPDFKLLGKAIVDTEETIVFWKSFYARLAAGYAMEKDL